MNHTTVSQQVYDAHDDWDTGFTHATSKEIRLKMKSRQVFHLFSDDPKATFKEYDVNNGGNSLCAKVVLMFSKYSNRSIKRPMIGLWILLLRLPASVLRYLIPTDTKGAWNENDNGRGLSRVSSYRTSLGL
jgi:hypothetical protein